MHSDTAQEEFNRHYSWAMFLCQGEIKGGGIQCFIQSPMNHSYSEYTFKRGAVDFSRPYLSLRVRELLPL
jgi:hypothetical protein